jgi:hypothetical protein
MEIKYCPQVARPNLIKKEVSFMRKKARGPIIMLILSMMFGLSSMASQANQMQRLSAMPTPIAVPVPTP